MTKRWTTLALLTCLPSFPSVAAEKSASKTASFEVASVRFEQNATDGDVEAVFESIAGKVGLAKLTIVAPDGRMVVDFAAPGLRRYGHASVPVRVS